jgi:hypothetical protein
VLWRRGGVERTPERIGLSGRRCVKEGVRRHGFPLGLLQVRERGEHGVGRPPRGKQMGSVLPCWLIIARYCAGQSAGTRPDARCTMVFKLPESIALSIDP